MNDYEAQNRETVREYRLNRVKTALRAYQKWTFDDLANVLETEGVDFPLRMLIARRDWIDELVYELEQCKNDN